MASADRSAQLVCLLLRGHSQSATDATTCWKGGARLRVEAMTPDEREGGPRRKSRQQHSSDTARRAGCSERRPVTACHHNIETGKNSCQSRRWGRRARQGLGGLAKASPLVISTQSVSAAPDGRECYVNKGKRDGKGGMRCHAGLGDEQTVLQGAPNGPPAV